MPAPAFRPNDLDLLWRIRFGEPPPVRASEEMTRRVLEAFDGTPPRRLCIEAEALEREAERACRELRAVRERSRRLVEEARVLAGARPAGLYAAAAR
jgi:hypothetical protein